MEEFKEYIDILEERILRLEKAIAIPVGVQFGKNDGMYSKAKYIVIQTQKASSSYLQRKLGIGHPRALKLIEALEEEGVIGPSRGSRPREIYVKKEN